MFIYLSIKKLKDFQKLPKPLITLYKTYLKMPEKNLLFGNLKSNLAICSLWTQKEVIAKHFSKEQYCFIGNLYSANGISHLIRTIYQHPQIRYLLVCGADLSGSGQDLVDLFSQGVDEKNRIKDLDIQIEPEIPRKDIELLIKSVKLIDKIKVLAKAELQEAISNLKKLPDFSRPKKFPFPKPIKPKSFPSEFSGFTVRSPKIADAFPQILKLILQFGKEKSSNYGNTKELLNLMAVIEEEDPDEPFLPEYLKIKKDELCQYYVQITTAKKIDGISYTYGQRLRAIESKADKEVKDISDQISYIIKELKKDSYSRRAIATTWDVFKDQKSSSPPCLILVNCIISNRRLYMTAFLRSNDMFNAWPRNCFGLRKLQKMIASALKVRLGSLTTISTSAHIYEQDWKKADEIIKKKPRIDFRTDPRGYFIIKIEDKKLKLLHYANEGVLLQEFVGATSEELIETLLEHNAISYAEHWGYIGKELKKAEIAMKLKLKYVQDGELEL